MLWIIYVGLICLGLFCCNSKLYDTIAIAYMAFLAWSNTDAADYVGIYLNTYLNPSMAKDIESGWIVLCQFGSSLGLSYNGFACVVTALSMIALRFYARKMGANTSFMLALFLIYPGLMSLVQFRQFVASAIASIAILVFLSDIRGKYLWFTLIVVIASLVHKSAIIIDLIILWPLFSKSGDRGRIVITIALIALAVNAINNIDVLADYVFGDTRTSRYLMADEGDSTVSLIGGVRNSLLVILMAVLPYLSCRCITRVERGIQNGVTSFWKMSERMKAICFLNIALLTLIPVVFITNDFMRFERYGFTYALAIFAIMPMLEQRHIIFSCKALYVAVCLAFAYFYVANSFDTVYGALLSFEYLPAFFS